MTDGIGEHLSSGAERALGRPLTREEGDAFSKYLTLLQKWQRAQRLIGSTDPDWIIENLFLDSLLFLRVLPSTVTMIADVGSGAGFPGIPLRIVRANLGLVLIESRERRASFLAAVIRELSLADTTVVRARVESVRADLVGAFDAVVMRCAGNPEDLLDPAARLVRPGGVVVFSGPPTRRSLSRGEWVEVQGVRSGTTRRFVILRL
jgi:16S rRNA (guanine527-N7)-methyltransferase